MKFTGELGALEGGETSVIEAVFLYDQSTIKKEEP